MDQFTDTLHTKYSDGAQLLSKLAPSDVMRTVKRGGHFDGARKSLADKWTTSEAASDFSIRVKQVLEREMEELLFRRGDVVFDDLAGLTADLGNAVRRSVFSSLSRDLDSFLLSNESRDVVTSKVIDCLTNMLEEDRKAKEVLVAKETVLKLEDPSQPESFVPDSPKESLPLRERQSHSRDKLDSYRPDANSRNQTNAPLSNSSSTPADTHSRRNSLSNSYTKASVAKTAESSSSQGSSQRHSESAKRMNREAGSTLRNSVEQTREQPRIDRYQPSSDRRRSIEVPSKPSSNEPKREIEREPSKPKPILKALSRPEGYEAEEGEIDDEVEISESTEYRGVDGLGRPEKRDLAMPQEAQIEKPAEVGTRTATASKGTESGNHIPVDIQDIVMTDATPANDDPPVQANESTASPNDEPKRNQEPRIEVVIESQSPLPKGSTESVQIHTPLENPTGEETVPSNLDESSQSCIANVSVVLDLEQLSSPAANDSAEPSKKQLSPKEDPTVTQRKSTRSKRRANSIDTKTIPKKGRTAKGSAGLGGDDSESDLTDLEDMESP
ncbi:hypothetical protein BJ741DRAFT_634867 [Chytriomyces cf. hyalinus JEL632]|nr:hypothetical protein BJ741DRAFT_634867 [Chytriomyces cf. hyalinus JEL632]